LSPRAKARDPKREIPLPPSSSPRRRKRFDPHRFVGKVVVYGLALDGAVRFLHWLSISIMHEMGW
jgi:hypothetical protein